MANFCTQCGAPLEQEAAFCTNCGQALTEPAPEPAAPAPAAPTVTLCPPPPPKPKVPGRGIGIASMVLGILSAFTAGSVISETVDTLIYFPAFFSWGEAVADTLTFSVMALLALIFSFSARKKQYHNAISTTGLTLGILGLFLMVASVVLLVLLAQSPIAWEPAVPF